VGATLVPQDMQEQWAVATAGIWSPCQSGSPFATPYADSAPGYYWDGAVMQACSPPPPSQPWLDAAPGRGSNGAYQHRVASAPPAANAWPRPKRADREPSRKDLPLTFLHELSSAPAGSWRPLVVDEDRRSYAFMWPKAFDSALSSHYLERLNAVAPWADLQNTRGTAVNRSTCWYARRGCTCHYTYGRSTRMENGHSRGMTQNGVSDNASSDSAPSKEAGQASSSGEFDALMEEIMAKVFGTLFPGLAENEWPNSANVNLYRDGRHGVGWHADDESLFRGKDRDCPIVSLSFGATREFWIALKKATSDKHAAVEKQTVVEVDIQDGDVMTMEGRMQRHCMHVVPRVNPREPLREERINITFRWIQEHRHSCPLRGWGGGSPLPRNLRGILGESTPGDSLLRSLHGGPRTTVYPTLYMRCWSREVRGGVISNPDRMEWHLCDGCKHKCYEDGRLCCEGQNDWAGMWFCRKCWARFEPDSQSDGLPLGPMGLDAQAEAAYAYHPGSHPIDGLVFDGMCPPSAGFPGLPTSTLTASLLGAAWHPTQNDLIAQRASSFHGHWMHPAGASADAFGWTGHSTYSLAPGFASSLATGGSRTALTCSAAPFSNRAVDRLATACTQTAPAFGTPTFSSGAEYSPSVVNGSSATRGVNGGAVAGECGPVVRQTQDRAWTSAPGLGSEAKFVNEMKSADTVDDASLQLAHLALFKSKSNAAADAQVEYAEIDLDGVSQITGTDDTAALALVPSGSSETSWTPPQGASVDQCCTPVAAHTEFLEQGATDTNGSAQGATQSEGLSHSNGAAIAQSSVHQVSTAPRLATSRPHIGNASKDSTRKAARILRTLLPCYPFAHS